MTMTVPEEFEKVYVNKKKLAKMPIDWMETVLSYIKVKLMEINNRAKLPENQNRDGNARLQEQANHYMAVQYRIGEEMNRRGRHFFEMITAKEDDDDGDNSEDS